uniref:Uncharacterized protein n=1 Tax=Candidatus Kentrum sp. LFY TaxID=2126342 RepID=A0A450WE62_9GAMM|nr:MAG: hypothetical protein BECKLFY1418C_GA0070996_101432 [Candidatus Kentron sp. LFY]
MKRGSITPENERFLTAFEMTCFLSSRSEAGDLVTLFGMYFHSKNYGNRGGTWWGNRPRYSACHHSPVFLRSSGVVKRYR